MNNERRSITLVSMDKMKLDIDVASAEKSKLLKELLIEYQNESEIDIQEVDGNTVKKIIEYLNHYRNSDPPVIEKPLKSIMLKEVTDEWSANFIEGISIDELYLLIEGAGYFQVESLLELACCRVASIFKAKQDNIEELRSIFNIEADMTDEDRKKIEDEYREKRLKPYEEKVKEGIIEEK